MWIRLKNRRCHLALLAMAMINLCEMDSLSAQSITTQSPSTSDSMPIGYFVLHCKYPTPIYLVTRKRSQPVQTMSIKIEKQKTLVEAELSYQYFNRRSSSENLFMGHSEANLATLRFMILYQGNFPIQATVRYNRTRPLQFDNQWSIDLGFDQRRYANLIKTDIRTRIKNRFLHEEQQLLGRHKGISDSLFQLRSYLESPAYVQQAFELRQSNLAQLDPQQLPEQIENTDPRRQLSKPKIKLPTLDTSKLITKVREPLEQMADSIQTSVHKKLSDRQDSLQLAIKKVEDSLIQHKIKLKASVDSVDTDLSKMSSSDQVSDYAQKKNANTYQYQNALRFFSKTNLRLGRFLVNYSDLTVNDIFLFGGQIRYGDKRFVMVSAGKYDFAFRQLYRVRNDSTNTRGHTLAAFKFGGESNRQSSAINFYIGRKENVTSGVSGLKTVAGYSYERKIRLSRDLSFHFEIAKSTSRFEEGKRNAGSICDLFTTFSSKTLGAYGSADLFLPASKTSVTADYQYRGVKFDAFNANSYYNPQNNASVQVAQTFFNGRLSFRSALRYTDFKTSGISNNIRARTWFASGTSVLRLKRLPVVSVGYYPGSQLYFVNKTSLYEYYYYILSVNAVHAFSFRRLPFQVVLSYSKFFNRYSDSLTQPLQRYYGAAASMWKGRFTWNLNYSRQQFERSLLWVGESGVSYAGHRVSMSGTAKLNFTDSEFKPGFTLGAGVRFREFATISLQVDKSFLPDRAGKIIPVESGRVQIIKPLKFRL